MTTLTPYREKVLTALAESDMVLEDEAGLVAGKLREKTGHKTTQALSGVLKAMEAEGLIRREMAGRRTFRIEATPAGAALLHSTGNERPAPQATGTAPEPTVADETDWALPAEGATLDYDQLGQSLLRAALRVLADKTAAKADANLGRKYLEAMREAEASQRRADVAEVKAEGLRDALEEARATIKTLEHNIKVIGAQVDKPKRGSDSVAAKISAAERRELASLMKSLPTARG